ncbi:hypothetical protein HKX48_002931 [Thoreauomyces humboldtii]|nr:hypothetical protein HKX48_002931 [Thoreauomyces humboldtii]
MRRAINLSSQQTELEPKDHTKPHEDVPYLSPLITLVENEIATKESFDHLSSIPAHLLKRNNSTAV